MTVVYTNSLKTPYASSVHCRATMYIARYRDGQRRVLEAAIAALEGMLLASAGESEEEEEEADVDDEEIDE